MRDVFSFFVYTTPEIILTLLQCVYNTEKYILKTFLKVKCTHSWLVLANGHDRFAAHRHQSDDDMKNLQNSVYIY